MKEKGSRTVWKGAQDDGSWSKPIWRWAEAFQNDWAARADWCVQSSYGNANHRPIAKVNGKLDRKVRPRQKVTLTAKGSSDPDGDRLSYKWWQYCDVDTATGKVKVSNASSQSGASFVVPNEPGKTIHIILEVTDDGVPRLKHYQRVICRISG